MKRTHFDVRLKLSAPPDEDIDERALEGIVRQALWDAEDGDDVRVLALTVSVIDTDVEE